MTESFARRLQAIEVGAYTCKAEVACCITGLLQDVLIKVGIEQCLIDQWC